VDRGSVEGKENSMAYLQRLIDVCIATCDHLIEQLMRYSCTLSNEEIKPSRELAHS
jgi:hypothetical protein